MKQLAVVIGVIAAFMGWSFFMYNTGKGACEAEVAKVTSKEEVSQATNAGDLKAGDVAERVRVKEVIKYVTLQSAPQDCNKVDIGDARYNALRGVPNN